MNYKSFRDIPVFKEPHIFPKAAQGEIVALAQDLDDYEATIALAYIKRLIKSRGSR